MLSSYPTRYSLSHCPPPLPADHEGFADRHFHVPSYIAHIHVRSREGGGGFILRGGALEIIPLPPTVTSGYSCPLLQRKRWE